jgi:hypothetical protein
LHKKEEQITCNMLHLQLDLIRTSTYAHVHCKVVQHRSCRVTMPLSAGFQKHRRALTFALCTSLNIPLLSVSPSCSLLSPNIAGHSSFSSRSVHFASPAKFSAALPLRPVAAAAAPRALLAWHAG